LSVVLYECEIYSPSLREEFRPRVFDNMVIRRILGSKTVKVIGNGEYCVMRSLMICTTYPNCVRDQTEKNETCGACGVYE